jgi:polyferredoxin
MTPFRVLLPDPPARARPAQAPSSTPSAPRVEYDSRTKKAFVRRQPDDGQLLRSTFQIGFALLNIWIGVRFYMWVRYYETGGQTLFVPRPPGVEGWLPIASLMNLKATVLTGELPPIHAAGMFLLVAFLSMSLLMRKAFCSWLCPIGTLSEWLWQGGEALFGRTFAPPRWIDVALRSLKYILLGLFLWAVGSMSVEAIRAFLTTPYGLIADVKMLGFFREIGRVGLAVVCILLIASVFVKNAWCRYLCPYGALLGLIALVSPTGIVRDPETCIDCAKCSKICPSRLPIDRLLAVRSAECTACLSCVSACPVRDALALKTARRRVPAWAVAAVVFGLFAGTVTVARWSGHWHTSLPEAVYFDLIPKATQFRHP